MTHSRIISVLVVVLAVIVASAREAKCDACWASGSCCSAQGRDCASDEACSCQIVCSTGASSCGCTCLRECAGYGFNLAKKMAPNFGTLSLSLNNGEVLSLAQFGNYLQSVVNWQITVDGDVASLPVPSGTWTGTMQQVLEGFASTAGVAVTINNGSSTIRLSSL